MVELKLYVENISDKIENFRFLEDYHGKFYIDKIMVGIHLQLT